MQSVLPMHAEGLVFEAGGNRLLHELTFTLEAGPRTVLLGPNGAGKSLTLRLCHGLLKPAAGRVVWAGPGAADASTPWGAARAQAMVFQRPVLLRRPAAANVAYALAVRGVSGPERAERVAAALARTGLQSLAGRAARTLSVGQQQRLALARAWALEPQVLFLDEPTASLDPSATRQVEEIIDAMHQAGTKIFMTTQDIAQARRMADEVLFLHHGRLLEQAPAANFFDSPASQDAAAFLKGELLW